MVVIEVRKTGLSFSKRMTLLCGDNLLVCVIQEFGQHLWTSS